MTLGFDLSDDQRAIQDAVRRVVDRFDESYWLARDSDGAFPEEFYQAIAAGGWLGIAMPEEYGGAGLGVTEAALMMATVADSPGGMAAASSIHINIFGPHPILRFGTEDQRRRWLPDLVAARTKTCFGVTEPDAGLETGAITTRAVREGEYYRVQGRKIWTSTAQVADRILLLARTGEKAERGENAKGKKGLGGLTLFYTALDRTAVEVREIGKMGRKAVDSNMLFIEGLKVPVEDRIGEEGKGFSYLLHSLNPERILVGAEAIGIGRQALGRAARYAREREVFGRPIGQNQAIQHPLAESWMALEAAWLMCLKAAWAYDSGLECGAEANAAKYLGAEAGFEACTRAVMTHGGMGYAREYHVERLMREVMIPRLAPVSQQLILCYIAEKVLGQPKSY